jgi:hypothetical protein
MVISVPASGMGKTTPLDASVREASPDDIASIKSLELDISGICREADYRFCIENSVGCLHSSVVEEDGTGIGGFAVSIRHPALNMIGPAFSRTETEMLALLLRELDRFRGDGAGCHLWISGNWWKLYGWGGQRGNALSGTRRFSRSRR